MKKVVLMGTPHYYNLGDIAIAFAEKKFIKDNFSQYELVSFSEENLMKTVEKQKENIKKDDLIFLQGGGNLGNEYISIEKNRRYIIESFPENKIIIFPQTIYFTNNEVGKSELQISKEIYSSHKNLTIIAREKESYEMMKKEFTNNKIVLLPDIVLYLNEVEEKQRNGALVILRSDREKNISMQETEDILRKVSNTYKNVKKIDIAYSIHLSKQELKEKLFEIWDSYRQCEIVITDRLHGMIFAAITNTPCIVFGNYNHKIESFYNTWFKDLNLIEFVNNSENLQLAIDKINNFKQKASFDDFKKKFNELISIIEE